MNDERLPWDIKELRLSLGGDADENGFITFQVLDDDRLNIYEGTYPADEPSWYYEEINIEAARRLRDFLNYAVPDKKG